MAERVQYVDENDVPIGAGTREEAWKSGTPLRVVRAVLRDENGRILSQHRSMAKKTNPGRWTDSASGHVDEGETPQDAIIREMKEEIGVVTELKYLGKFLMEEKTGDKFVREVEHVFEGTISSTTTFELDSDEVDDIKWFELRTLKTMIANNPNDFTKGVREIIARFYS